MAKVGADRLSEDGGEAPGRWRWLPRERLQRDLVVAVVAAMAMFTMFITVEPFEDIYEASRRYEALEIDDILLALLSLPMVMAWFSWRRACDWRDESARRRRAEAALEDARDALENKIAARTRDLEVSKAQVQTTHNRLVEAIEAMQDGFYLYDADDRLVLYNSVFRAELGSSAKYAVPGRKFADILPEVVKGHGVPEGVGDADRWIEQRIANHQRPDGRPVVQRRKDGRWIRVTERRTADGGIVGIRSNITDSQRRAEALRESEQQLRLITDSLPVLIVYVDADGIVRFINKTGCEWYARPRERIIGKPIADMLKAEALTTMRPLWRRALAGEPVNDANTIAYNDGKTRHVEVSYVPHWDEDRVAGFFGLVEDVSGRKATEAQLRQSQKLEAVGRLTGGIAHDFNNLLGVVLGNLEMLGDTVGERPQEAKLAENAEKAALRGAALTQRLLAFSRKQDLAPQVVDVAAFVSETVELLRHTLGQNIVVDTKIATDAWPLVADPAQLETAILNLAINARDAMPAGGDLIIEASNVTLDARQAARHSDTVSGDYLMITVRDTGTGMTREVIDQAFEPFFTTKEVGKGTGLGLSMVFGFVKQSGGFVDIASTVGQGTSVKLYLPRASSIEPATHDFGRPRDDMPEGRETVLVVEDNYDLRHLATTTLGRLGYTVVEANTGDEALGALQATPGVNLVFADMLLPGDLDGVELARAAQAEHPGVKVLLTSGNTARAVDDTGTAYDVLAKPYRRRDLAQSVRALLDDVAAPRRRVVGE